MLGLKRLIATGSLFVAVFGCARAGVAAPYLVINEIHYDVDSDLGSEAGKEWIELVNRAPIAVDLGGYRFAAKCDTDVAPCASALVESDPLPAGAAFDPGTYRLIGGASSPAATGGMVMSISLTNSGDVVALYDPFGDLVDMVAYDDTGDWPPSEDGVSIELLAPDLDNDLATSWVLGEGAFTGGIGTPGAANADPAPGLGVAVAATDLALCDDGGAVRVSFKLRAVADACARVEVHVKNDAGTVAAVTPAFSDGSSYSGARLGASADGTAWALLAPIAGNNAAAVLRVRPVNRDGSAGAPVFSAGFATGIGGAPLPPCADAATAPAAVCPDTGDDDDDDATAGDDDDATADDDDATADDDDATADDDDATADDDDVDLPPVLELLDPDDDEEPAEDDAFIVRWSGNDPDSAARVTLSWDTDDEGFDGVPIATVDLAQGAEAEAGQYEWDVSELPSGVYFVYAKVDDFHNAPVFVYAPGSVRVERASTAPELVLIEPDGEDDEADTEFVVRWTDSAEGDDARIELFLDDDSEGEDGTAIPGAGDLSEDDEADRFEIDTSGLDEGDHWVYAVVTSGEERVVVYSSGPFTVAHETGVEPEPETPCEGCCCENTGGVEGMSVAGLLLLGILWRGSRRAKKP